MSSARTKPLFASSSIRLSIVHSAILVAAFLLAGLGSWVASRGAAETELRQRIQSEMSALQEEIRTEGDAAAIAAIQSRADGPGSLEYQFIDQNGRPLVHDLAITHPRPGWSVESVQDADDPDPGRFLVLTQATPAGGYLMVGDDLERAERVRLAVLRTLALVGISALTLALVAGWVAARAAAQRMDALSRLIALAGAGDFSARASADAENDDIAALGLGINEMLSRIERLVADVKRVSTGIAHDLRTPLAHVRQQLETAQTQEAGAARDTIRAAQSKIDEVLRTFAAMLRLAEIESGSARKRFTNVNLAALADRVADAYRPDSEAQGHSLTLQADLACSAPGDPDLLAQALANLVENAMRHTPAGAPIAINVLRRDNSLRLEVEDKGPGIAESDRQRMLAPFERLDSSRGTPGAGLGLSIVSAIARLHGAELLLEDAGPGLRAVLKFS